MNIRHVKQTHPSGCGPACIAMVSPRILSRNHKTALLQATQRLFKGKQPPRGLYTHYHHIKSALDSIGVTHSSRVRPATSWTKIKDVAVVKCGVRGNYWHWVVYDGVREWLYDPLKPQRTRVDGRTRRPASYLALVRSSIED